METAISVENMIYCNLRWSFFRIAVCVYYTLSTLSPDVFRGPCVLGTTRGTRWAKRNTPRAKVSDGTSSSPTSSADVPPFFLHIIRSITQTYSLLPASTPIPPPPPHLLPLYTEPEICFKQMCVNVSLSTWLLSYKNSILAISHILPTMQQPFSLQNEKN